ncbi:hypothetical protein TTHERM_001526444 (macronuclear) [Tetrahymena thermophila SB210]|uniref:Transmembrane protein n=1 Tax=Tetrahymena thermophila (strain SB210) TaxID=312017 RepID=W7XFQ1_TETTS|nr:hypothetical protein TTHERM_001526444 [Tetrahymena thermophila SB210]EWS71644.1 hypothetical protein TTHERM_001526444 [Tetrahymena thermophila SB210]|eukprot:XP_012655821.1 hypothetical protein TTHERM_001526444 [Tetrahymena thermophila SB210]
MKQIKYLVLTIFIVNISKLQAQQCQIGCQACVTLKNNISSCNQCLSEYQLSNGSCIYQNCQQNLFYQNHNNQDENSQGSCQSICDPLYFADLPTNTCQKQVKCSSIYSTQPNFLNNGIPTDFFTYQKSYYVSLQQGYLSIYNKSKLDLVKNLSYQTDDLRIQNIGDLVVILKKDFSINIWDIINENSLNLNQPIIFSFENKGNIIQMLQSTNSSRIFAIFANEILEIDLIAQTFSTLILQQSIQKVKIITSSNDLITQHLIILTGQSLLDYNYITKQSNLISNENQIISDFDVGTFTGTNSQLIVLSNQIQLIIYNFANNQYQQSQQTFSLNFQCQFLKKIPLNFDPHQENESQMVFEIVLFSQNSIQIIRNSNVQESSLELDIIENFNLPFPTPSSQTNSVALTFSPQLLISCHQNGDIIFYDASRGININLIQKLSFQNQTCLDLQKFHDNRIAALMGQNILLIDPQQQIILNQFTNLTNIIQIVSNYDKLAINYNNCIQIVTSEFKTLFLECQTIFSSNNLNIVLSYDSRVFIQKAQEISIYQINFESQQASNINQIFTTNQIQYFNRIQIFNSDQDTILNKYSIDEIVYFDAQSNFYILDGYLSNSYVVKISLLKRVVSVKRVINDASVYFLAGFQLVQGNNSIFLVSKNLSYSLLIHTNNYFPSIEEPKKIINAYGNVFYGFTRTILLSTSTLFKQFQVDIKRNITYIGGHDHINIGLASGSAYKMIGSPLNFQIYYGSQLGLIYTGKYQQNRYQVLPTNQILQQNNKNDQILEIIQSAKLGMINKVLFVGTKTSYLLLLIVKNRRNSTIKE